MKKRILYIVLSYLAFTNANAQVTIIRPDVVDGASMKTVNGKVIYAHETAVQWTYELYATDGTDAGTGIVKDINPNYYDDLYSWATTSQGSAMHYENFVYKDRLYFYADDGVHGMELWKSDATNAGTNMFYEFNPGLVGWDFSHFKVPVFCEMNNLLYMTAGNTANGNELWVTDGNSANTTQVIDLNPGAASSQPSFLTVYNGRLYFAATDGTHGWELYSSDGTAGGTQIVKDMLPGTAGIFDDGTGFNCINPHFVVSGNYLYFQSDDVGGIGTSQRHWWRTDGTDAGTFRIETTLFPWDHDNCAKDLNGTFYFTSYPGGWGADLWKSDGTVSGTTQVTMGNGMLVRPSMIRLGNDIYFDGADNDSTGIGVTDGSSVGSRMMMGMQDVAPFDMNYPAVYGDDMFFSMGRYDDDVMGVRNRLVQSNGTRSGTIIYPLAQPRSKVIPLGNDYIFYGSDTIERINNPFATYLFKLTPSVVPVGIGEAQNNKVFSCYPNPASDRITILSNGFDLHDALISISDVTGKNVYSKKLGAVGFSEVNIELPQSIADGFYLIEVQNAKQRMSDRLVIHKN